MLLGYLHESASHALSAKDMSDLLEDYWYRSGLSLPRSPPEAAIKARHLCPAHHHHATAHMDVILPGKSSKQCPKTYCFSMTIALERS